MIRRFALLLFGCSALPFITLGQAPAKPTLRTIITPAIRVKPGAPPKPARSLPVRIPRPIITPDGNGTPPAARKVRIPAKPKTPQEKLHAALTAVKFDRTPDGILNALDELTKKAKPQKDKAKAAAERFRCLANAGRWDGTRRKHIQSLPYEGSPEKAYCHLISSLLRAPATRTSASRPLINAPPIPGGSKVTSLPAGKPRPMLTQEDFVEILKLAPSEPNEADIAALANLLRGVGQANLSRLAKQLETGSGQFGGDQPDGRKRVAQLLQPLADKSQAEIALKFVPEERRRLGARDARRFVAQAVERPTESAQLVRRVEGQ